jgi:hypothetical protein
MSKRIVNIPVNPNRSYEAVRVHALIRLARTIPGPCSLQFIEPGGDNFAILDQGAMASIDAESLLAMSLEKQYVPSESQLLAASIIANALKHAWTRPDPMDALRRLRGILKTTPHIGLIGEITRANGFVDSHHSPIVEKHLLTGDTGTGRICWSINREGLIQIRVARGTEVAGDRVTILMIETKVLENMIIDPGFSVSRHNAGTALEIRHLEAAAPILAALLSQSSLCGHPVDTDDALGRLVMKLPKDPEGEALRQEVWATS